MNTENNKIIAEFMIKQEPTENFCVGSIGQEVGVFTGIKTEYFKYEDLKFHSDWNWLMEVVEKIESLNHKNNEEHFQLVSFIHHWLRRKHKELTKIEAVYNACIEFIKWYNEQNKV